MEINCPNCGHSFEPPDAAAELVPNGPPAAVMYDLPGLGRIRVRFGETCTFKSTIDGELVIGTIDYCGNLNYCVGYGESMRTIREKLGAVSATLTAAEIIERKA